MPSCFNFSGQPAYRYDGNGNRLTVTNVNNSYVNYTYDPIYEMTSALGYESGGAPRNNENFNYVYDYAGNLIGRTNDVLWQNFTANGADQLVNITRGGVMTVAGNLTNSSAA